MSFQYFTMSYLDSLSGHLMLVAYLLAVTDEQAVRRRLKKLPPLMLSPLIGCLISLGMDAAVPEFKILRYFIFSVAVFILCTLWTMWTWQWDFWRAVSAVGMAAILQVASSALIQILFLIFPSGLQSDLIAMAVVLLFAVTIAVLLKWFRFGVWFRLMLEDQAASRRTAVLILALEISMEAFLVLQNGVQGQYLAAYYMLVVVLVMVIIGLIVYLAHWIDGRRTLRMQQDMIAQQQLYEQSLEDIRREVRSYRHDYKNLLAGLAGQAVEGKPEVLRAALSELEIDFDRNLGEKIRLSVQIGNLRIPQIRSLLLSKLTEMKNKGVECRLEVIYPVENVYINVWDFVRCLGILADNAIEAALDTEQPWVEILLLAQEKQLSLQIYNPYTNTVDPAKMWDDGWSTKGAGRGLGLSSYQRIVKNYSNVSACTSWENGVFVQELTVEDRP